MCVRRWPAVSALAFSGMLVHAEHAAAACDVIPQPETGFRGAVGSLNRVFATPGEPIRIAVDTNSCEAGSPGFVVGAASATLTTFESRTLEGWTCVGAHASFGVQDNGNPGFALNGRDGGSGGQLASARAPAAYLGTGSPAA